MHRRAFLGALGASGAVAALLASAARASDAAPVPPSRCDDPDDAIVREDFARGRIVVVDGWVLSATEARRWASRSTRPA